MLVKMFSVYLMKTNSASETFTRVFRIFLLTCSHAECPHIPHHWSRGFWDTRCRAGGSGPVQGRSTQLWTPDSQTPDSSFHSPPPLARLEHWEHWCSHWPQHSRNSDIRLHGSERRWSAGKTGAESQRKGQKKPTSAKSNEFSSVVTQSRSRIIWNCKEIHRHLILHLTMTTSQTFCYWSI